MRRTLLAGLCLPAHLAAVGRIAVVVGVLGLSTAVVCGAEVKGADPLREPTTFRDVRWGASRAEADAAIHFSKYACSDMRPMGRVEVWCSDDFKIGDKPATSTFIFANEKFVQSDLSYDPSEFDFVRDTLIEKYGAPSWQGRVPLRTKAGVEYVDDVVTWKFPGLTVEAHRYGTTVNRGVTYFTTAAYIAEKARRAEESKKKAKTSF